MIKAYASGGSGKNKGTTKGTTVRPTSQKRRGRESMGAYYRRTGVSMLGGNSRTRGVPATIKPTRGR